MIDMNPAKVGVDNPTPRRKEQRPFESWGELEALAEAIGPRYGPMIIFAAATGLRPAEWIALEKRDIDRAERVAYVRRSFTKGELKRPKTEGSIRAVPLQAERLTSSNDCVTAPTLRCSFPASGVATSTSTTSVPPTGGQHNSQPGSIRSAGSTICGTLSQPSRSVPASQPSTSPATWAPA